MFDVLFVFYKVASFCAHLGFPLSKNRKKKTNSGGGGVDGGQQEPFYLNNDPSPWTHLVKHLFRSPSHSITRAGGLSLFRRSGPGIDRGGAWNVPV